MQNKRFLSLAGIALVWLALLIAVGGLGWAVGQRQSLRKQEAVVPASVVVVPTRTIAGGLSRGAGLISGRVWHDLCAVSEGEDDSPPEPSAGCAEVSEGTTEPTGSWSLESPCLEACSFNSALGCVQLPAWVLPSPVPPVCIASPT
jgi:hypothetical protein